MSVKKIFIILITVVVCVLVGALVINLVAPKAMNSMLNAVETNIKNATGLEFDLGADETTGDKTGDGYETSVEGID